MNETKTISPIFDTQPAFEEQELRSYFESLGLAPRDIGGQLCLSKTDTLRLCRMVNTKRAAEFEKWIRRRYP